MPGEGESAFPVIGHDGQILGGERSQAAAETVCDIQAVLIGQSAADRLGLRAQQRMQLLDGSMMVCNVPEQARRVLDAAGIGRLVTIR